MKSIFLGTLSLMLFHLAALLFSATYLLFHIGNLLMKTMRVGCLVGLGVLGLIECHFAGIAGGQSRSPPQPGPELAEFQYEEGAWDVVAKLPDGKTSRGTLIAKVASGGYSLVSELKGQPEESYNGRGVTGFDATNKKYVGIWIDSMTRHPVVSEGTYDKATKTLVTEGDGQAPDGSPLRLRSVRKRLDDDHMTLETFAKGQDNKEHKLWTLELTRRK